MRRLGTSWPGSSATPDRCCSDRGAGELARYSQLCDRYVTRRGARTLNEYARDAVLFTKIGVKAVIVKVIYVVT
jgi:hypothetical protein